MEINRSLWIESSLRVDPLQNLTDISQFTRLILYLINREIIVRYIIVAMRKAS